MMNRWLLVLLLNLVLFGQAAAQDLRGFSWTYDDLTKFIEDHPRSIRSVDDLLRKLPRGMKYYSTFVFDSGSAFQDASPDYPRAIVFNEELIMTFNGHPDQKGFNSLELLFFDHEARRFQLREISFTDGKANIGRQTPDSCLQCHGADPKPIWTSYDDWPGVYGSKNDSFVDDLEKEMFQKFKRKAFGESNVYSYLYFPPPRIGNNAPSHRRPNKILSRIFLRLNALRVSRLIEESPYYREFKWLLPHTIFVYRSNTERYRLCNGSFPELQEFLDEIVARHQINLTRPESRRDKMYSVLGLPVSRTTPDPLRDYNVFSGGSTGFSPEAQRSFLITDLLQRLATEDARLKSHLSFEEELFAHKYDNEPIYRKIDKLAPLLTVDEDGVRCDHIRSRAEEKISVGFEFQEPLPVGDSFVDRLTQAEKIRIDGRIPSSCVYCHVVVHDGPIIHFENRAKLQEQLNADDGRLFDAIVQRIASEQEGRMPPPSSDKFAPLVPAAQKRLLEVLTEVRE